MRLRHREPSARAHRSCRAGGAIAAITFLLGAGDALGNEPPETPVYTEPASDGQIVNPFDVHMETAPFADPDAGDTHVCTDWEIWVASPLERVWRADCIGGVERVHVHLGDGVFEGAYAGRRRLEYDTDYRLRVRHRDSSGSASEWSAQGERLARTGSSTAIHPLLVDDVLDLPPPTWVDNAGVALTLPAGTPSPSLRLESPGGSTLLAITPGGVVNPPPLAGDGAIRVVVAAGGVAGGIALPESRIDFVDNRGFDRAAYLPSLVLAAGESAVFWLAADGSTFAGTLADTTPSFAALARGAPVPWIVRQPGYRVEVVATGFQLPVAIAFVPNPGPLPSDPLYYVAELYGAIKVVRRDGVVGDYATDLLDYDPLGAFPGSGEQGLGGLVIDPASGDLFASMLYDAGGPHYPKVVRFSSLDGGLTAATQTTILDMAGESQGQSHQISNLTIGPDGKLYVHMGDGFDASTGQNLSSFRGKILRIELDGSVPIDNPFYAAADGITARDHVFAYGFRNAFGGAWSPVDDAHYVVENGPSVDRLARIVAGRNYGWNGTDQSMRTFALYNWDPSTAPVNIAFVHPDVFGGSGFPEEKTGRAFVTESGPTYASGPQGNGKRISEFALGTGGEVLAGPNALVEYGGTGYATAVGLAAGPDGLYFTDLYKDQDAATPIDVGANVLRISYLGRADFTSDAVFGTAPLAVRFFDTSNVPSPSAWSWDFGDGSTSTDRNPTHTYAADGVYDVTLSVTGANGVRFARKVGYLCVGVACGQGLRGEYFADMGLNDLAFVRTDPTVDFSWGSGSPDPRIGDDFFSVRWTGRVKPDASQTYRFYTTTDDGVRLWVNNQLLVDRWIDQSPTEWSGSISLVGGVAYDVTMEFYERGGGADARLAWSSAAVPKQVIPATHLEPRQPTLPPPACAPAPETGCRTPFLGGRSRLTIHRVSAAPSPSNRFVWTWNFGRSTSLAELGNPLSTTGYSVCTYDGASALVSEIQIAPGGSCGRSGQPCWKAGARGFNYADNLAAQDGVKSLRLRTGGDGQAQIALTAVGTALPAPALPLDASSPARVQMRSSDGGCWETVFPSPARNDVRTFRATDG